MAAVKSIRSEARLAPNRFDRLAAATSGAAAGLLPRTAAAAWLRDHAGQLRSTGQNLWRGLMHVLFGMVGERARLLGAAFRSVAFAQVRIAALNAGLTAVYLMAVAPAIGIHVPFAKTMIAVTLITGLLPVVGNLIANVVITLVSLSVSPVLA
jgi:hypothetical protein